MTTKGTFLLLKGISEVQEQLKKKLEHLIGGGVRVNLTFIKVK